MACLHSEPQAGASSGGQGEISLWLRIGVFGHRDIAPDHPGLMRAVSDVLAAISNVKESIRVRYRHVDVGLTAVSSLAEGADRILARAVLTLVDARLEAVLPLGRDDYRDDFRSTESKEEFDDLMDRATMDVVGPKKSRKHAYALAGKAVVDRSDVIVAVWDGKPARGRGGTAEIYAYAVRRRKPMFWIRVDGDSAELAEWPADFGAAEPLLPPESLKRLDRYNDESLPTSIFADPPPVLAHLGAGAGDRAAGTAALLVRHVGRYFTRADTLAVRFQRRWFWVTRLLYALAALAVAIVAAQVVFAPAHERYAWFEFGTLVGVTILVLLTRFARWHDRWISARYFAEQMRSLVFLALAGVAAPDDAPVAASRRAMGESGWTDRAVAEIWWTRPRYDLAGYPEVLRRVLDEEWISDQLEYHVKTGEMYAKRSRWFAIAAIALFTVSALVALLHSLGVGPELVRLATPWDYLSVVIPAIGAALSGYAAQRDYARHSERWLRVAAYLTEAHYRLQEAEDLADVQQVVLNIRGLMRDEISTWYSIVHSQEVEPP
jgi:hypothetical protein